MSTTVLKWTALVALAILLVVLLINVASQLDVSDSRLAFDWKNIHAGLNDTSNPWSDQLQNPPWTVIMLLPMGQLSVTAGWLLVIVFTLAVIVVGEQPKRPPWKFALAAIMIAGAFPTMRSLVDGNIDALAAMGILLIMAGLKRQSAILIALGVLAATAKPQSSWMVVAFAGMILLRERAWRTILLAGGIVASVVVVTMLWGGANWLSRMERAGSGITLRALLAGVSESPLAAAGAIAALVLITFWAVLRKKDSPGVTGYGLLAAASILTAPYSSLLSLSTVVLLGVVPMAFERPLLGIPVYLLYLVPYLGIGDINSLDPAIYPFFRIVLLITWGALLAHTLLPKGSRQSQPVIEAPLAAH